MQRWITNYQMLDGLVLLVSTGPRPTTSPLHGPSKFYETFDDSTRHLAWTNTVSTINLSERSIRFATARCRVNRKLRSSLFDSIRLELDRVCESCWHSRPRVAGSGAGLLQKRPRHTFFLTPSPRLFLRTFLSSRFWRDLFANDTMAIAMVQGRTEHHRPPSSPSLDATPRP